MDLEELSLGELIRDLFSKELHKHELLGDIESSKKREIDETENMMDKIEEIDTNLTALYFELNRRESQYRKI